MAKIFLKVRKYQCPPIGAHVPPPTWMVCNSVHRDFEPSGCSWPHLIESTPMTMAGGQWTEADAERSMRSYALHLARQRPGDYEVVQ